MSLIEQWRDNRLSQVQTLRVVATIEAECNLACEHCYWSHDLKSEKVTDWSTQAQTIANLNVPMIYAGRLLTKAGLEFFLACQKAGVSRFGIVDNGYTIFNAPPALLESFEHINISIDGVRENHDRQRRKVGSFDKSWEAIVKLKNLGHDPVVASAYSPLTVSGWDRFEAMLAEYDVPLSSTLVSAVPAAQAREVAVFLGAIGLRSAFKTLLGGIPKIINIYDIEHVIALKDIFKSLTWVPDPVDGDCLTATADTGAIVIYRPPSVQWLAELSIRWDGKFYEPTVNGTEVGIDPKAITAEHIARAQRQNERELSVWSEIL